MCEIKEYNFNMQNDVEVFYEKCFIYLGWGYEPYGRHSDILDIQKEYMQNGCFWCLYDGRRLIGTVAIRTIDLPNKVAELKRLYVINEEQGKGYSDLLFSTALEYAKNNDYYKICADTQNDRAVSKYLMRKYGFRETARHNADKFADVFFELVLDGGVR